jgi:hypothetical protein
MALTGIVTKAGCMQKTATVTVSRHVIHKLTGKVYFQFGSTKKYTHPAFSALSEAKRSSHTTKKKVCRHHIIFRIYAEWWNSPSIERYRVNTKLPSNIRAETL